MCHDVGKRIVAGLRQFPDCGFHAFHDGAAAYGFDGGRDVANGRGHADRRRTILLAEPLQQIEARTLGYPHFQEDRLPAAFNADGDAW